MVITDSSDEVITPFRRGLQSFELARRDLVYRDDLTGLGNRRLLSDLMKWSWEDLTDRHKAISLLMIDLDRFKEVNDRHGHLVGDRVLRKMAKVLRGCFRTDDLVVRFGGDEFAVVLPGMVASEAGALAERAREAVHSTGFEELVGGHRRSPALSFSVGVASYPVDGASGLELLASADRRLYQDKALRREHRMEAVIARARRIGVWTAVAGLAIAVAAVTAVQVGPWADNHTHAGPDMQWVKARAEREDELLERVRELEGELASIQPRRATADSTDRSEDIAGGREGRGVVTASGVAETGHDEGGEAVTASVESAAAVTEDESFSELTGAPEQRTGRFRGPQLISAVSVVVPEGAVSGLDSHKLDSDKAVRVVVTVDAGGRPVAARTVGPELGHGLEEAAVHAAMTARFTPGQLNGKPIQSMATLVFRFAARD